MKIVIMLFVLVGGSIAFSAWKKFIPSDGAKPVGEDRNVDAGSYVRTCLACEYEGEMKTWLSHYTLPKFMAVAGFLLGYIPGLIFLGLYWGKYKCPSCGSVGKNQGVRGVQT